MEPLFALAAEQYRDVRRRQDDDRAQPLKPAFDEPFTTLDEASERLFADAPEDTFYEYSVVRVLLYSGAVALDAGSRRGLQRRLMSSAWQIGEYEEAIALADAWLADTAGLSERAQLLQRTRVLNRKAKALRNLGRFDEALLSYRDALSICDHAALQVEKAFTLLQIGKLYGNYLNLGSAFSLFITRALELLGSRQPSEEKEYDRRRYRAICEDSLGQIDSRSASTWESAVARFERAMKINKDIGYDNGISRNLSHIAVVRSKYDPAASADEILDLFDRALSLLRPPTDDRGAGHRKVQAGEILDRYGRPDEAQEQMESGREISRRFRDYRSYVRGSIALGRLARQRGDSATAILRYSEGKEVAARVNLTSYELEINRALAELVGAAGLSDGSDSHAYLRRNREILGQFQSKLVTNAAELRGSRTTQTSDPAAPELQLLTKRQQLGIYDALITDYGRIIQQFQVNFESSLDALESARDLSLLELAQTLSSAVWHELKHVLPRREGGDAWERLTDLVTASMHELESRGASEDGRALVRANLAVMQADVQRLAGFLDQLRELSSIGLSRGPSRSPESLARACHAAIRRAEELSLAGAGTIELRGDTDVLLPCSHDWLVRTVLNLLRNAITAVRRTHNRLDAGDVVLRLTRIDTGDVLGNLSHDAAFDITNAGGADDFERLQRALLNPGTSDTPEGTGIGLQLATFIFGRICRGTVHPSANGGWTTLRFLFRPDGARVKSALLV
jgi:tetratricopeptide (TPR) repeat protein